MRAIRFSEFGEPAEVLTAEELPTPSPGPTEILVRMSARPVNPSDLLTVRGFYGTLPELPATPGYEGVGVVEATGSDIRNVRPGQRVVLLGARGTWQQFLVVGAGNVIPVPESISDDNAAQFLVNPLSAWVMLTEELAVQSGQWLLQTAAGSTLGRIVLQIAKLRGIKTINIVRRREQALELRALGADEVVCTGEEDLTQRVTAITGGAGVPAAIDAVGGDVGSNVALALAPRGVMLIYGMLSLMPMQLNGGQMVFRRTSVRGFWLTSWIQSAPPEKQRACIQAVLTHMAKGEIVPPVEAKYDLNDVTAAVQHAERPGRHGKVLLVD